MEPREDNRIKQKSTLSTLNSFISPWHTWLYSRPFSFTFACS